MTHEPTEHLVSDRPLVVRRRVQWGECDPAGVVYTPRFADYYVSASDWFQRVILGLTDRPHPDRVELSLPARALAFDFRGFLAADDMMTLRVSVAEIRNRSFTLLVAGERDDGVLAFFATGTRICFDRAERMSVAIPPAIRAALEAYRAAFSLPDGKDGTHFPAG